MTILSIAELRSLMDVSAHKRDETITSSIEDTEAEFVKKFFGNSVYVFILENLNSSPANTFIELILDGGIYESKCSPPKKYHFNGLRKAIALLVYCDLLIKQTVVTRFGATNKNDTRSSRPTDDESLIQVNRYKNSAISHLKDIDFLLLNIDTDDYDADSQALIEEYRTENNDTVKVLFEAF